MFEKVLRFVKETLPVRNLELLSKRITEFQQSNGKKITLEMRDRYKLEKAQLVALFGDPANKKLNRNLLFHGTGILKYPGKHDEDNPVDFSRTEPVLEQILMEGLVPQVDDFMPEGDEAATSLVESYFYAKSWSDNNMADPEELQFQFGKPTDWITYFLADTFKCEMENLDVYLKRLYTNRKKILETMKDRKTKISPVVRWASGTRNNVSPKASMIEILHGRTTIPNNWGAVLCIDKRKVKTKRTAAHETRTGEIVSPEAIVAIGVPLHRLAEAKELIERANSQAVLFSLEGADIHLSLFPMKELAKRID
jgi:hypothetical protein